MSNRIRINCKKVYDNGQEYMNASDTIAGIQNDLKTIKDEIESIWVGVDDHNFKVSFGSHIEDLNPVIDFLKVDGDLLKTNALQHSGIDNEFATKMERSDVDERY
jgi:uncharacterized protein YukE